MNILIVTIEAGGNLPPVKNVIRQLTSGGSRVTLLGEPVLEEFARSAGASFVPFKEYFTKTDPKKDMFEDWKSKNNGFEKVLFGPAKIVVRETLEELRRNSYDLLIADVVMPTALMAAEVMKIPRVVLFHFPEYMPGPNRPPGGLGLTPSDTAVGKVRDRLLGWVFDKIFNKYLSGLNKVRHSVGLSPMKNVADLFRHADLRLIQTSPHFDWPILPAPANVRYTGPVLDDPDWAEPWVDPREGRDFRPLVVVSLSSTFQNQRKVLQNCMDALGMLPVRGVVTLGPSMKGEEFHTPDNVRILSSGSHATLFPLADALLTHAGHGTVIRALANGLPMVCLPMGRDQNDNAAKVVYHKAGLRLPAGSNPERIAKAVRRILSDPGYKDNASRIGEFIRNDRKEDAVLREIERLIHGRTNSERTAGHTGQSS